jgi:iron complex transport system substrate-binding protein
LGNYVVDKGQESLSMIRYRAAIKGAWNKILHALIVFSFSVLAFAIQSQGREITDIFGKMVSVPDRPQRVYATSPPLTYMLYAIDPSILAGLNSPLRAYEKKYLHKGIQTLPVLGGWFGQGEAPNLEMVLKASPEIVITSKYSSAMDDKVTETMKMMSMPVIDVKADILSEHPDAFLYLGRLLGREARGKQLASYTQKTLSEMAALSASIPAQKRTAVYYAEGPNGLNTECDSSRHSELINLAGGRNVHHCETNDNYGMAKIPFEQLMLYNPEVIFVMEDSFYSRVFSDPLWQQIKAVRNKRVYLIPKEPFNWFDRPPSFMRVLGAKWVARALYPDRYKINMVKETQDFYKLFLGISLTTGEAQKLIQAR